jgi:hypothetical protein
MTTNHPDDAAVLARWDQLHRPPIPVAVNEQGLVWKTVTDLAVYLSMLQDAGERGRAIDWVLEQRDVTDK